ncbi:MAG TPA: hypothetical protein PKH77_24995 [Anaerolineae bacterium]|nr:hypothetical protein [Anaerolineae bacterium]
MVSHKTVFTQYLRSAPRVNSPIGGRQMADWGDWLDEQGIARCEACGKYGTFGEEVSYLPEGDDNPGNNSNSRICHACMVTAWAWTHDEMMLRVTCPVGEEVDWLANQARYFGDRSGLREWGYEDCPSHVTFTKENKQW